ncbi:Eco57I restriction-modification methylase domain-containing protein [Halorubrum vacuolatum]|uniref:site-specific DNA-methyltransferase (adenine-specific) n=1 Tax=Halorubrum vacuolatum TaxID=63740 RepID=A0A238YC73_HALVU|nr:N-6 DNA methylase [Halorubrum vacuolatum]SNR68194.1 Type I restriction enzyme R protein N terminus (HSDR_N) [Halorubrum vacuolatum]
MSASLDLSDTEQRFIQNILNEYAAIYREIDFEDRPEPDIVPRLIKHLFINVLDHSENDYEQENDWNDIIFKDADNNAVIVVEAKRRSVDVEEGIEQGFEYAAERNYVEYFISTNLDKLLVYETCEETHPDAKTHGGYTARKVADINFEGLVNQETGRALTSEVDIKEYQDLLELNKLRREEVVDVAKFDQFDIPDHQIQSVATEGGFNNLLEALEKAINEYFMVYTLKRFDEYQDRHEQFKQEHKQLKSELEDVQSGGATDTEEEAELKRQISEIEEDWDPYRRFQQDFEVWKQLSNRVGEEEVENKRVFCRESVYTQINKILFIRIAEDKGLLNTMVSNGGVTHFFEFWRDYARYTGPDKDYRDLFNAACDEMMEIYEHLYSGSIFDWELRDGSALNEIFKKTFWQLNHYDFSDVDRDVLGHLYEQHLPKEERQTLGEFYTPTEVVNFILDRLEYTADQPIEHKDVLDPATGSGTFLVQAANRLVERLNNKGVEPKEALKIVQERLHGLDLNPFAINIAQINLVFQIIDLYKEVKEEHPHYTIDNFKIYQTDSLKRGIDSKISGFHSDTIVRKYQEDKQQADAIKTNEYDIVVGNPPYVFYNDIPKGQREAYNKAFPNTAYRQYDILILFIDSARDWLKPGGKASYITSNKFTNAQYAEKLRQHLPRYLYVNEFIDFADAEVFEDVVNYPCIFTMQRKTDDEEANTEEYRFPFVRVKQEKDSVSSLLEHINTHIGTEYEDEYLTAFSVSSEGLEKQSWKFVPDEDKTITDAIRAGADRDLQYRDACDRIERGFNPGYLPAYFVTDDEIEEHDLETEIIHPALDGEDIRRWRNPTSTEKIIYTPGSLDIDKYPNVKEYLRQYKDRLEERTTIDKWWELRRPRPGAVTDEKKIITPDIAYYNNYTLLDGEGYPLNTIYYTVPNDEGDYHFLLGLANSIVMQFYMRMALLKSFKADTRSVLNTTRVSRTEQS